jgi:polyphosphate glucokinase
MAGHGFGVDIGGSGIKGAVVDLATGELVTERFKVATPRPSTPEAVGEAVAEVVTHLGWSGPIGTTFPAVVRNGVALTAANVDQSWIGTDVAEVVGKATGMPATAVNDADAAGLAETLWGAARDVPGLVLVVTLGTGIGTALIHGGVLVPNSELGHIEIDGEDIEKRASAAARERESLSWEKWAKRLQRYLRVLDAMLSPDLFVIGGGVSRRSEKFLPYLDVRPPVVPAQLLNQAGIVGAAHLAALAFPS